MEDEELQQVFLSSRQRGGREAVEGGRDGDAVGVRDCAAQASEGKPI